MRATQVRRSDGALQSDRPARRVLVGLAGLQFGGCQINALDLAARLRAGGDEVTVFAVADDGVKVSVLPYAASLDLPVTILPGGGLLATARQVRRLAVRHDVDVVHVFAPWLGIVAAVAAVGRTRPANVVTNWNMHNSFWGPAHSALLVGTGAMAAEARQRHAGAVYLLTPPIDVEKDVPDPEAGADFRRRHDIGTDELLLTLVSRVDRAMKLESIVTAIRAVELLDDPTVRLVVVGDGDALDEVRELAGGVNARLGRPTVLVLGALLDPHPAYAAADVVLGMGGAALRGLSHARPVVVQGAEGFSLLYEPATLEHIEREGFYGHGCDGDPVAHLAHLLTRLHDSDLRHRLGLSGRLDVERDYSLTAGVTRLRTVYDAEARRPPGLLVGSLDAAVILGRTVLSRTRRAVQSLGRPVRRRPVMEGTP